MPFDNRPLTGTLNTAGFMMHVDQLDLGKSELGLLQVLYHSAVSADVTGTTAETNFGPAIMVPGGLLGANGMLRVSVLWTYTASANAKSIRLRWGGITLGTVDNQGSATSVAGTAQFIVSNRNNAASQVIVPSGSNGVSSAWSVAPNVTTIDSGTSLPLQFSGILTSAPELIRLERVLVEVLPT